MLRVLHLDNWKSFSEPVDFTMVRGKESTVEILCDGSPAVAAIWLQRSRPCSIALAFTGHAARAASAGSTCAITTLFGTGSAQRRGVEIV